MSMPSQRDAKREPEKVASVRLTVSLHDWLKERAAKEHRTISQELRRMIEQEREAA